MYWFFLSGYLWLFRFLFVELPSPNQALLFLISVKPRKQLLATISFGYCFKFSFSCVCMRLYGGGRYFRDPDTHLDLLKIHTNEEKYENGKH